MRALVGTLFHWPFGRAAPESPFSLLLYYVLAHVPVCQAAMSAQCAQCARQGRTEIQLPLLAGALMRSVCC